MTHLQGKILECLLAKPRTIEQVTKCINRFRIRKIKPPYIERAFDYLESEHLVEELGKKEAAHLKETGAETSGEIRDLCGLYALTDSCGIEAAEALREERRRYYLPLYISWGFSTLSILISVLALLLSRG